MKRILLIAALVPLVISSCVGQGVSEDPPAPGGESAYSWLIWLGIIAAGVLAKALLL